MRVVPQLKTLLLYILELNQGERTWTWDLITYIFEIVLDNYFHV